MNNTSGWAVRNGAELYVNTISATRRAAIVNWLVVCGGAYVTNDHTDEQIEMLWHSVKSMIRDASGVSFGNSVDVIEVEIFAK